MLNTLITPHTYPGKLFVVEGIDGSGRTTQITLLREWLEVQGYGVIETGLTRSPLMQPTIELAKASNTLNKLTFTLLYACDFADRLEKEIIPALKAGFIVLADRYIFTAIARAGVRGIDRQWIRNIYGFAIAPHLTFYLKIDADTLARRVLERGGMDYWESGMDMGWSTNPVESFRLFQSKVLEEYDKQVNEFGLSVIDASGSITDQQRVFREMVSRVMAGEESDGGTPKGKE
jgi:dTMP kinase